MFRFHPHLTGFGKRLDTRLQHAVKTLHRAAFHAFNDIKSADIALNANTCGGLWEQRASPVSKPLPASDYPVNGSEPSAPSGGEKTKLHNNFPQTLMDSQRHSFTHTTFQRAHVYTHHKNQRSPQTFGEGEQDESVNRTCFEAQAAAQSHSVRQQR